MPVRPPTRALVLFAPLALAPALWGLEPAPSVPGRAIGCAQIIELDGLLVCGTEIVASSCPAIDVGAIGEGDSIVGCVVGRMDPDSIERLELPVDVNHASMLELASLPGIGPTIGQRIVDGRPYASVDELDRVVGIGDKRLAGLRARARTE